MNRKQKIIVSVTGIFIVLLILVGLTYAYFLTNIRGNTNTKSIEVSTANLILLYEDGNGTITANNIMPGTTIDTKTFTVTNDGNAESSYIVVFENVAYKRVSTNEVLNGFDRQEDLKYTLVCKQYDKDIPGTKTDCNGVTDEIFPTETNQSLIVTNTIPLDYIQEYTLTLNYIEPGVNQSEDMGKSLSAKVNIKDIRMSNPYATIAGTIENPVEEANDTLAYNIIHNAAINKNGTSLMNVPLTIPAEEVSAYKYTKGPDPISYTSTITNAGNYYITYASDYSIDENTGNYTLINPSSTIKYSDITDKSILLEKYIAKEPTTSSASQSTTNIFYLYQISNVSSEVTANSFNYASVLKGTQGIEKVLSVTPDDYGTSYYFRGGVEDNYINFAGMCFRIVRIEGNGNTKIILEDSNHECNSESYTGNWTIGGSVAFGYNPVEDGVNYYEMVDFLNYSGGLADTFQTYQGILSTKITSTYIGKTITDFLNVDEWCYDDTLDYDFYGAANRIFYNKKPSLKCTGTKLIKFRNDEEMYVSTLTADEMAFAGVESESKNYNYYLTNYYAQTNHVLWWTLSPFNFIVNGVSELYGTGSAYATEYVGHLSDYYVTGAIGNPIARPAVTLKSNIEIISTGDGTKNNPYVIK